MKQLQSRIFQILMMRRLLAWIHNAPLPPARALGGKRVFLPHGNVFLVLKRMLPWGRVLGPPGPLWAPQIRPLCERFYTAVCFLRFTGLLHGFCCLRLGKRHPRALGANVCVFNSW